MPLSILTSISRMYKANIDSIFSSISITPNANGPYPVVSAQSIDNYGTSVTDGVTYNVYAFTNNSSTSKPVSSYTINYTLSTQTLIYVLAVGGGGGGVGGGGGGGASAGGVVMTPVLLPSGTNQIITISIGAGGAVGTNGNDTTVQFSAATSLNITALKGVIAGNGTSATQISASTGGGGYSAGTSPSPLNSNRNYGSIGGIGSVNTAGGGGGAGICGNRGIDGGNGGNGIQCFLPGIKDYSIISNKYSSPGTTVSSLYWGGGGGSGVGIGSPANAGAGGLGGGGSGNTSGPAPASGGAGLNDGGTGQTNGLAGAGGENTGGGAGGTWTTGTNNVGGSGIVIIAFPKTMVTTSTSSILTNSSLSSSAYNSICTAYGCKLLNYNYFGPIFTLRYSTDISGYNTKNFYVDTNGNNIGDSYLGTGTSLNSWLTTNSANTTYAFITKWYDQGMDISFNCSVQYTTTLQPIYEVVNKVYNSGYVGIAPQTRCYLKMPNYTLPTGDDSYTIIMKALDFTPYNSSTQLDSAVINAGNSSANQMITVYYTRNGTSSKFTNGFNNNDAYVIHTYASNLTLSCKYTKGSVGTRLMYINNVSFTPSYAGNKNTRASVATPNWVTSHFNQNTAYMGNCQLYFMYILSTPLNDQDRNILENT